mmetsp:Transcript_114164/g.271735  ORF Transcript_114164/g.271735 Transcript_114164/m.271735 type:complete len:353 (-) Transcript_114164:235-1293(-)
MISLSADAMTHSVLGAFWPNCRCLFFVLPSVTLSMKTAMIKLKIPIVTNKNSRMYANMKIGPFCFRSFSCRGVPSYAAQPSVKQRKAVNIAEGTSVNSSNSQKRVREMTPRRYMQPTNNTTAQKSTRRPVKTPWIINFSSWKILNFSNRTIRPKRASFSILRDPKVPAAEPSVDELSCGAWHLELAAGSMLEKVKLRSTMANTTQMMSNQLQYQSAPRRYSLNPNTLSFITISPMKKIVKQISKTFHTIWSGQMSALIPAMAALRTITQAGMTSRSNKKVELSSDSSSSIGTLFRLPVFCRFSLLAPLFEPIRRGLPFGTLSHPSSLRAFGIHSFFTVPGRSNEREVDGVAT